MQPLRGCSLLVLVFVAARRVALARTLCLRMHAAVVPAASSHDADIHMTHDLVLVLLC